MPVARHARAWNAWQLAAVAAVATVPTALFAHDGRPVEPHDLLAAWTFDPWISIPLAASALLYAAGVRWLWREERGRGIRAWEAWSFAAGVVTLLVALLSPLHAMGEALFSAHMTQHALLMSLAAPLLVLGRPVVPMLWGMPIGWRRMLGAAARAGAVRGPWRAISRPAAAWLLHAAAIVAWHLPALYDATLSSRLMHALQHASFLGTALLFWWALLQGRERRTGQGAAIIYLFTTMMYTGALGALLTFAPRPWYTSYLATTGPWGLTPLEDQQLAGLIMWIPASIGYLVAALWLLALGMRDQERRALQWQHGRSAAALLLAVLLGGCWFTGERVEESDVWQDASLLTSGNPREGRGKLRAYGCTSCHVIPGVPGAQNTVGPSLAGIATRMYIAGRLPNNPQNMMQWIRDPQSVDSLTAMPRLGVSQKDVRDIAAYLYTLR